MKAFPWKEFLQRHPIFATVRDEKRIDALLAEGASWERTYAKDDVLFRQGDVGSSGFVIGAGSAEVLLEVRPDATPVLLSVMRRGEVFGEMALLEHRAHSATVRANETCTVLEVRGVEFESLMADYPDIEFKLLLKMSERLRHVGEQVLGGQIGNVDEKLKMFGLKLDTEQKLVDCALRAAQAMFDQTKLRADEVISSAERSRDRLQKMATLVTALAGIVITILGAFGFKQIWDVSQMATEIRKVKDDAVTGQTESSKALDEIKKARGEIQTAQKEVAPLALSLGDLKGSLIEIVRTRLFNAVLDGKLADARRDYRTLRDLAGLEEALTVVDFLQLVVFVPKPSKDEMVAELMAEIGADSLKLADASIVVRASVLRIAYSILTGQSKLGRQPLYNQLRDYLKNNPNAALRAVMIPEGLLATVHEDLAAELRALGQLTTAKL